MNKELEDIKWIKETAKLVDIFIEQIITNEKFAEIKERNGIIDEEYEEYKEYKYSKSIEKVFNYIENSISKEVIEEKQNKYKQQLKNNTKRVVQLQVLEQNKSLQQSEWEELNILLGDIEKIRGKLEALRELMEGK